MYQLSDIFNKCYEEALNRKGKPQELSIFSLPTLNNKIWGFKKQKLNIIGGRPSNGKSVLMLQLAWDFARQGKNVLFFSLEMTKQTIVERIISKEIKINNQSLYTGNFDHNKYARRIMELKKDVDKINFVMSDTMGKTFDDIFRIIEKIKTPIDVVFLDYIQMVKNIGKTKKEAIDDYIKKLREYAINKDFCAVVASQINRGTHNSATVTPPNLWELKSSGDLEEHCDLAMLVHYPGHYDGDDVSGEYQINIAKNRDGATGNTINLFQPQYSLIKEVGFGISDKEK